jgi:hypothetical protein
MSSTNLALREVGWISQRVLDLSHRSSENRAARGLVRLRRSGMRPIERLQHLGRAVLMGHQFHQLSIELRRPHPCAPHRGAPCAELNTTETLFPGTKLRLIYDLVSSKNL